MYFSQWAFTHLILGGTRFHWASIDHHAPVKGHRYFGTAALCCRGLNQRAGRRKCSFKQKHLFLPRKNPIRKGRWVLQVVQCYTEVASHHEIPSPPPKKKNKHARMQLATPN